MINPYSGVAWETVARVMSCSHEHSEDQAQFNRLTETSGLQHIAISNYYPSAPVYPLSAKFDYGIPANAISCPNAEHHNLSIKGTPLPRLHLNGLGSFFSSGSPRGETPLGCQGVDALTIVSAICNDLQFSDGGGVTINHPYWSNLSIDNIEYILDYDDRVLGLEIFNSFIENAEIGESMAGNIEKWDAVLSTGRRCWGFCVADHQGQQFPDWMGRNILLVDEATEHKCLQAYRKGAFYGQLKNSDLKFINISFNNRELSVQTENAEMIKVVIDGIATELSGNSVSVSVPKSATYVRAEGHSEDDIIFTNPIILKEYVPKPNNITENFLLFMS